MVGRWTIAADGEPLAIAQTPGVVWVAEASDTSKPGRVQGIDATTGTVIRSWRVGSQPAAIAAAGGHIWIVDAAGPDAFEPNLVVESDLSGHTVHTYPIANPVSVAADGNGAWIGSSLGDRGILTYVGGGKVGPQVTLPGTSADGSVPVVACGQTVFAATTGPDAGMLISSVSPAGTVTPYGATSAVGVTHLACLSAGLLVETAEDTVDLFHVTSASGNPDSHAVPARTGLVAGGTDENWIVTGLTQIDHSAAAPLNATTLAPSGSINLAGDAVAATTGDQGQLWLIMNNVQGSAQPVLVELAAR